MPKVEISQQKIIIALESRSPKSLTEVYRILGGTGKLSGSIAKKMRELVPGIEERLANNKAREIKAGEKPPATLPKSGKTGKGAKMSSRATYPRCDKNPFREGSNYALAFDVLASSKDGLPLADWRERYAKTARKPLKLASYDIQVLLTAKGSPTGERHKSCRDGFFIERQCDHVRICFN